MTTRVGRLSFGGDGGAFDAALDALEVQMAPGVVEAQAIAPVLRRLQDARPFHITAAQITRMLTACFRLTGVSDAVTVRPSADDPHAADRVGWACGTIIHKSLNDERSKARAFTEHTADHARIFWPNDIASRTGNYRPMPNVPLDRDAAEALLAPYFDWLDARRDTDPTAHLKIAWDAVSRPLPPFEGLFWDWLDRRSEGEDMRLALSLHGLHRRAAQRLSWSQFETLLVPLLAAENPLVVAHAAAFIGSLYADDEADRLIGGTKVWDGARILTHIAALPRYRRTAAGAFLHGIDAMDPNPFAEVTRIAPDLDIAEWVMTVLADRQAEAYIPECQAFWFYLHEHYDRDVEMVLRMIEAGHNDVAWMCITENRPPAEGMERALQRMAAGSDLSYAEHAARLLTHLQGEGWPPAS